MRSQPQRTCIGCRQTMPSARLVRCVFDDRGPTTSRTSSGRGAWLCSLSCFDLAQKRRAFDRAWKRPASPEVLATLRIAFEAVITNMEDLSVGEVPLAVPVPLKG